MILFDTHIALWALLDDPRLPRAARALVQTASEPTVSAVALVECAIKHRLPGRSDAMPCDAALFRRLLLAGGYAILPLDAEHAEEMDSLPMVHRDPFDRLMLCQARRENVPFVTADARLADYGDPVLMV